MKMRLTFLSLVLKTWKPNTHGHFLMLMLAAWMTNESVGLWKAALQAYGQQREEEFRHLLLESWFNWFLNVLPAIIQWDSA